MTIINTSALIFLLSVSFNACSSSSGSSDKNTQEDDIQDSISLVPTIVSSVTNKVWMDRNLGASRACQSIDDIECYGDYYQWGRDADGHENPESNTTDIPVDSLTPNHSKFIIANLDWTNDDPDGVVRNNNWNPCPDGFKIPTKDEILAENILDRVSAYDILKLPSAGNRLYINGKLNGLDSFGNIWAENDANRNSSYLHFYSTTAYVNFDNRAEGKSVRCIQK